MSKPASPHDTFGIETTTDDDVSQRFNGLDVSVVDDLNAVFNPLTANDDGLGQTAFQFPQSYHLSPSEHDAFVLPPLPLVSPLQQQASFQSPNVFQQQDLSQTPNRVDFDQNLQPILDLFGGGGLSFGSTLGQGDSNIPADELSHSFNPPPYLSQPWYPTDAPNIPLQTSPSLPEISHSATPSFASIDSIVTDAPAQVNVFTRSVGDDGVSQLSSGPISRQSSMASISSLVKPYDMPPISVVHSTPGKMGKMRSSSRITPYPAHGRSDSIASNLSTGLPSTQQYWNSGQALESPLNRMSIAQQSPGNLRHRRPQSKHSGNWSALPTATRPRAGRSASISVLQSQSGLHDVPIANHGSLDDRAEYIHQNLADLARSIKLIGHNVAQHDKARTHWVRQWLRLSYTPDSYSGQLYAVPRKAMYASYEVSCKFYGVKPINSASFGKAVKGAYPGYKTRRLGKRGDSHYHLIAIRPSTTLEASRLNAFDKRDPGVSRGYWFPHEQAGIIDFKAVSIDQAQDYEDVDVDDDEMDDEEENGFLGIRRTPSDWSLTGASNQQSVLSSASSTTALASRPSIGPRRHTMSVVNTSPSPAPGMRPIQKLAVRVTELPGFPSADRVVFAASEFFGAGQPWQEFCQYLQNLVDCVAQSQFQQMEPLSEQYWTSLPSSVVQAWQQLTMSWNIRSALTVCLDYTLGHLVDQVVRGPALTQAALIDLGELADSLEDVMSHCWSSFDETFRTSHLELVGRVGHTLRRILDLIEVSERLSLTLSNPVQSGMMITACDKLDLAHIAYQCALSSGVTGLAEEGIRQLIGGLHDCLRLSPSIVGLADWVDEIIAANQDGLAPSSIFTGLTLITAEILRDLWLREDAARSQFQVLKLWVDEYMNIWSIRQSLSNLDTTTALPVGQAHSNSCGEYAPLSIGVPEVALYDDSLATATLANQHAVGPTSQFGGVSHAPPTRSLAPPFDVDSVITPRQNLSMSELIDPKPEPSTTE